MLLGGALVFASGVAAGWFSRESFRAVGTPAEEAVVDRKVSSRGQAARPAPRPRPATAPDSAGQPATGSDVPETASRVPRTASEVLERLLNELETSNPNKPGALSESQRILGRLMQLQDFGEEGSQAIHEFFKSQEDIVMGQGSNFNNGRLSRFPTLRTAMLEMLYDMENPSSQEASLDILRNTTSGMEAMLAARNLEKFAPGMYRAEALSAVEDILSRLQASPKDTKGGGKKSAAYQAAELEIVGYYHATEMIPEMEAFVRQEPGLTRNWMNTLLQFPVEEQVDSIERLIKDPNVSKSVAGNSYALSQLDFHDDDARKLVRDIFTDNMTKQQKEQLVNQLGNAGNSWTIGGQTSRYMRPDQARPSVSSSAQKARIEGTLLLLAELEPQLDPALKKQADKTRKKLEEDLKKTKK